MEIQICVTSTCTTYFEDFYSKHMFKMLSYIPYWLRSS